MGSIMAKVMDDNMKKQQEFMLDTQKMQVRRRAMGTHFKGRIETRFINWTQ